MYVTLTLATIQVIGFFGVTKIGQTFIDDDTILNSEKEAEEVAQPLKL